MTNHQVVIVGGGPTGLMLASELALAGVDVAIVERRATQDLAGSRAGGLLPRVLEQFDQRGIAERFISQGTTAPNLPHVIPLAITDAPTRHNYILILWQEKTERTLLAWAEELGVHFYRSRDVTGFNQNTSGVDIALSDGASLHAQYLVGCDGGRSLVRKQAGIEFPGWDASTSYLIAEAGFETEPTRGIRHNAKGINGIGTISEGRMRAVVCEPTVKHGEPSIDELREALVSVWGTDYGARDVTYLSRFSDMVRQAVPYRVGRVLVAGDAAHVHSPTGGQGMHLGQLDAMNLGWKLAQVVKGVSPEALLDTYQAERHPATLRILRNTMASTALNRGDDQSTALRESLVETISLEEPRKRHVAMLTGLDIRFDLGEGHPLLGRRMPDLEVDTADGPRRVYSFLHRGQPLVLNLGAPLRIDGWADRVQLVDARYTGVWELPVLGTVAAPSAVLVRPDGYVAWVGDGTDAGLREALTTWCGAARS